jgi:hypothetical protein
MPFNVRLLVTALAFAACSFNNQSGFVACGAAEDDEYDDAEDYNDDDAKEPLNLEEADRMAGWIERNYTWPPSRFVPETAGWRRLMTDRFVQIERDLAPDTDARFEAFVNTAYSAYVVNNFTTLGFGLARADPELVKDLRSAIRYAVDTGDGLGTEGSDEVIPGPNDPWFVDLPDLTDRVLHEMHPYVEAWSGVPVVPHIAYGFRLYRNESALYMHTDELETHVLSLILHIDSSDDAEPWPIVIEDFEGNTHEVTLTPGDVLFYESSKCFHGRPRPLSGTWYSSVFVHYTPVGYSSTADHNLEAHYAVPPHWNDAGAAPRILDTVKDASKNPPLLRMAGSSMHHPDCAGNWCVATGTLKRWSGPGLEGHWIAPDQQRYPLDVESAIRNLSERGVLSEAPTEEL